jgi:hypothetical protein
VQFLIHQRGDVFCGRQSFRFAILANPQASEGTIWAKKYNKTGLDLFSAGIGVPNCSVAAIVGCAFFAPGLGQLVRDIRRRSRRPKKLETVFSWRLLALNARGGSARAAGVLFVSWPGGRVDRQGQGQIATY